MGLYGLFKVNLEPLNPCQDGLSELHMGGKSTCSQKSLLRTKKHLGEFMIVE